MLLTMLSVPLTTVSKAMQPHSFWIKYTSLASSQALLLVTEHLLVLSQEVSMRKKTHAVLMRSYLLTFHLPLEIQNRERKYCLYYRHIRRSVVLLSTLGRPQLFMIPLSCLWTGLQPTFLQTPPLSSAPRQVFLVSQELPTGIVPSLTCQPLLSRAGTLTNYQVELFSHQRLSLHNWQTFLESVATPRTQSPFCPSAADYTKVMKQAEKHLMSTENERSLLGYAGPLSQTSCTSTIGYKRLGLSHTVHALGQQQTAQLLSASQREDSAPMLCLCRFAF